MVGCKNIPHTEFGSLVTSLRKQRFHCHGGNIPHYDEVLLTPWKFLKSSEAWLWVVQSCIASKLSKVLLWDYWNISIFRKMWQWWRHNSKVTLLVLLYWSSCCSTSRSHAKEPPLETKNRCNMQKTSAVKYERFREFSRRPRLLAISYYHTRTVHRIYAHKLWISLFMLRKEQLRFRL